MTRPRARPRWLLLTAALLACAVAAGGCGPNIRAIIADLSKSDRSWCFYWAGTPAFSGPFRVGGSGVDGGTAICNADVFTVNTAAPLPVEVAPLRLRIVPQ